MDRRYKLPHVLVTEGDQESGYYAGTLIEIVDNSEGIFEPVKDNHKNGLQEMRRKCAAYLRSKGYSDDYLIQHHCRKPGRIPESKNRIVKRTILQLEKESK